MTGAGIRHACYDEEASKNSSVAGNQKMIKCCIRGDSREVRAEGNMTNTVTNFRAQKCTMQCEVPQPTETFCLDISDTIRRYFWGEANPAKSLVFSTRKFTFFVHRIDVSKIKLLSSYSGMQRNNNAGERHAKAPTYLYKEPWRDEG